MDTKKGPLDSKGGVALDFNHTTAITAPYFKAQIQAREAQAARQKAIMDSAVTTFKNDVGAVLGNFQSPKSFYALTLIDDDIAFSTKDLPRPEDLYRLGLAEELGAKPDTPIQELLALQEQEREAADNLGLTLQEYRVHRARKESLAEFTKRFRASIERMNLSLSNTAEDEPAPASGRRGIGNSALSSDDEIPVSWSA